MLLTNVFPIDIITHRAEHVVSRKQETDKKDAPSWGIIQLQDHKTCKNRSTPKCRMGYGSILPEMQASVNASCITKPTEMCKCHLRATNREYIPFLGQSNHLHESCIIRGSQGVVLTQDYGYNDYFPVIR